MDLEIKYFYREKSSSGSVKLQPCWVYWINATVLEVLLQRMCLFPRVVKRINYARETGSVFEIDYVSRILENRKNIPKSFIDCNANLQSLLIYVADTLSSHEKVSLRLIFVFIFPYLQEFIQAVSIADIYVSLLRSLNDVLYTPEQT